jgi:hypothetical protein
MYTCVDVEVDMQEEKEKTITIGNIFEQRHGQREKKKIRRTLSHPLTKRLTVE